MKQTALIDTGDYRQMKKKIVNKTPNPDTLLHQQWTPAEAIAIM